MIIQRIAKKTRKYVWRIALILKEEGIVLRTIDYSDTSQIVTVFCKNCGKIGVIAKGAKRKKNPNEGLLQPLNLLSFVYYQKPTGMLGILKECEVQKYFGSLRKDLRKVMLALYFAEFTLESTAEADPNTRLFQLLEYGLRTLCEDKVPLINLFLYWQWHALNLLGLSPCLARCVQCKIPMSSQTGTAIFSSQAGGVLCKTCQSHAQGSVIKVKVESLARLYSLIKGSGECWKQIVVKQTEYDEIFSLFHLHIQVVLDKCLRLARYIGRD